MPVTITRANFPKDENGNPYRPVFTVPVDVQGNIATGGTSNRVQGSIPVGTVDSDSPLKVGGYSSNSPLTAVSDGQRTNAWFSNIGAQATFLVNRAGTLVDVITPNVDAIVAAANNGLAALNFGYVYNGTTWDRAKKPNLTSRISSSAASTNATVAKASVGEVHNIIATNTTAALKYLKLYNKATAPTVGTDTPVLTIALAPSNALTQISIPNGGEYFSTGIAFAITGAAADADATAVAAGDVVGLNITYS